jgi:polysaccharide biosynthesis protein PslG
MRNFYAVCSAILILASGVACSVGQAFPNQSTAAAAISVHITPNTTTVASSESVQFTAVVSNTPHVAVTWSASQGTISSSGLYQAPSVTSDTAATITATSAADRTKSETASVVITAKDSSPAPEPEASGSTHTITDFFFGADFNGGDPWPPTDAQHRIAILSALRLWDDGVKWGQINTSAGVFNWRSLDNWIARAQSQHMDVLYTFGDTPKWAGSIPKNRPCTRPSEYSCSAPKDVNQDGTGTDAHFSDFVKALMNRYKGQIKYFELWNEADCKCFFAGTQAQLVRMAKDAAAIIRSHDPNARILSPSAHGGTMATFFQGFIAAGGASTFDIVDVHMRGAGDKNMNPENFLNVYNDVMAQLRKNNLTSRPLWDGEHGNKLGELTDPDKLAGFVAREILLRAGIGIQRQYIYTWDNKRPVGLQGNDSGTAWNTVAGWLLGHSISPCVANGNIYSCNLDNGQVVWDTAKSCGNGTCATSQYTYPTTYNYKTDLEGRKTALGGRTVSIGYKPIFLTRN